MVLALYFQLYFSVQIQMQNAPLLKLCSVVAAAQSHGFAAAMSSAADWPVARSRSLFCVFVILVCPRVLKPQLDSAAAVAISA